MDYAMMRDLSGRLTGVAQEGEAAAEFAYQLSASREGRSVTASLRRAAAAPLGAERVSAVGALRGAVASYLARFPVQRPELEQALRPAAVRLRAGPPGPACGGEDAASARGGGVPGAGCPVP